jgi:hypothetical protein
MPKAFLLVMLDVCAFWADLQTPKVEGTVSCVKIIQTLLDGLN